MKIMISAEGPDLTSSGRIAIRHISFFTITGSVVVGYIVSVLVKE